MCGGYTHDPPTVPPHHWTKNINMNIKWTWWRSAMRIHSWTQDTSPTLPKTIYVFTHLNQKTINSKDGSIYPCPPTRTATRIKSCGVGVEFHSDQHESYVLQFPCARCPSNNTTGLLVTPSTDFVSLFLSLSLPLPLCLCHCLCLSISLGSAWEAFCNSHVRYVLATTAPTNITSSHPQHRLVSLSGNARPPHGRYSAGDLHCTLHTVHTWHTGQESAKVQGQC